MKILVTGGCGYIGTQLVKKLKEDGQDVKTLDTDENADYVCDLSHHVPVLPNFDYVYHLAASSRVEPCENNRKKAFMDNVVATENICYRFGQIIYPHTYLDTKTTYGYTKALSARIVEHYGGTVKVLTNVFGYDGPGVIDSYLRKYEKDESLGICLGETRFDFVHMDEVVRRLISTAFSYVGSGKLLSLESVANMFPLGTTRHYFQGTPHTHRIQEPKSLCSGMTVEEYIGRNI